MAVSFLHPQFLWALPLALVPLILHLLFRRKPPQVPFASLLLIRQSQKLISRRMKLRQLLLLIVRTLLAGVLVFAAARPFVQYRGLPGSSGSAATRVLILLLDASYSMAYNDGGTARFDRSKALAKKIIAAASPHERIGVIAYSDRVESVTPRITGDHPYLERFIDGLSCGMRTTDISSAWPAVRQLVQQMPGSDTSLILLSDTAAHGMRQATGGAELPDSKIIYFEQGVAQNRWIGHAAAQYDAEQDEWQIAADLSSMPGKQERQGQISWHDDGRKIGEGLIDFAPGKAVTERFSYPADTSHLAGSAVLAPDRLQLDDIRYFTADKPDEYGVAIIDGDPQFGGVSAESYYVRNAFPDAVVYPDDSSSAIPVKQPGVMILANTRNAFPAAQKYLESGGGVIVFLGENDPSAAIPFLPVEIGARFSEPQGLSWTAEEHPVNKRLSLSGFDWSRISIEKGYVLRPKQGAQVLASLSSGWPFIVEGSYAAGKILVVASTADREWNNMVNRPVFVPLLRALARYCSAAPEASVSAEVTVGEPIAVPAVPDASLRTPNGTLVQMRGRGSMSFTATDAPGIYTLFSGGRPVRSFAVNLAANAGESDLTPATPAALKKYFNGMPVIQLSQSRWERELKAAIYGADLSRYLLALVALLLLAETLLANRRRKKEKPLTLHTGWNHA